MTGVASRIPKPAADREREPRTAVDALIRLDNVLLAYLAVAGTGAAEMALEYAALTKRRLMAMGRTERSAIADVRAGLVARNVDPAHLECEAATLSAYWKNRSIWGDVLVMDEDGNLGRAGSMDGGQP